MTLRRGDIITVSLLFIWKGEKAMSNFAWLAKARVKRNPTIWVRGGVYADYDFEKGMSYHIRDFFGGTYDIDENSICYCSGLTDRNGILIFAGDRIFLHDHETGAALPKSYIVDYDTLMGQYILAEEDSGRFCHTFYDVLPSDCEVVKTIEDVA